MGNSIEINCHSSCHITNPDSSTSLPSPSDPFIIFAIYRRASNWLIFTFIRLAVAWRCRSIRTAVGWAAGNQIKVYDSLPYFIINFPFLAWPVSCKLSWNGTSWLSIAPKLIFSCLLAGRFSISLHFARHQVLFWHVICHTTICILRRKQGPSFSSLSTAVRFHKSKLFPSKFKCNMQDTGLYYNFTCHHSSGSATTKSISIYFSKLNRFLIKEYESRIFTESLCQAFYFSFVVA